MREWRDEITSRLAGLALEPAREAEIVDELEQHLADRHAELVGGGTPDTEARRQALDELETHDLLRARMQRIRQASTPPPFVPGADSPLSPRPRYSRSASASISRRSAS